MTSPDPIEILRRSTTIAVVGASDNPERPAHRIPAILLAAGYRVIPVNPKLTELLGQQVFPSLADVPEPIDIVDVFRRAEHTPPIAAEAVAVGAKTLWLQLGIVSAESRQIATDGGLDYVEDACTGALVRAHDLHPPLP